MRDEKRGKITHLPLPAGKQENPPCKKMKIGKGIKIINLQKKNPKRGHMRYMGALPSITLGKDSTRSMENKQKHA